MALKGYGVVLTSTVKNSLLQAQSQGKVTVRAPVKIKVGFVKSWTITIKVDCDIMVDSLTANPKIFSLLSSPLLSFLSKLPNRSLGSAWEFIKKWNGMEWNDHKGMEMNGMYLRERNGKEWNEIK